MTWFDNFLALLALVGMGLVIVGVLMVVLLRFPLLQKRFPAAMRTGLRSLFIGGVLVALCLVFMNGRGAQFRVTQKHLTKEVINASGS